MHKALKTRSSRLYQILVEGGNAVNSIEFKKENDHRSKTLSAMHWNSLATYNAIIMKRTQSIAELELPDCLPLLECYLHLPIKDTFNVYDSALLASIFSHRFPNGHKNEYPSVVLVITEWLIHKILRPLDVFFVDHWLFPTVEYDPINEYTFTFSLKGPVSAKYDLDMALRENLTVLFAAVISDLAGLLVSDVFDEVNSTLMMVDPSIHPDRMNRVMVGAPIELGRCTNFAILSRTGVTSAAEVTVEGNIGVSPIASGSMTGFSLILDPSGTFATSPKVGGRVYAPDYTGQKDGLNTPAMLGAALGDANAAYDDAIARTPTRMRRNRDHGTGSHDEHGIHEHDNGDTWEECLNVDIKGGSIGGEIFRSGVYKWNTGVTITSDIIIKGPTHCKCKGFLESFIFIVTGDINVSAGVRMVIEGDVKWSNIIWQTTDAIIIAAGASVEGIFLSAGLMSLAAGSFLNGRALVKTAVTLATSTNITQSWEPYTRPEADPI